MIGEDIFICYALVGVERVEPLPRCPAIRPGSTVSYHRSRAQSGLIRIIVGLPWEAEWGLRLETLRRNGRDGDAT